MDYRALAESIELFASADCHRAEDRRLAERYLAALAPLLAGIVLGKPVLREIQGLERLFGHSWLGDPEPFERAFAKWREFRDTYVPAVLGSMTVNERLCEMSLADDYDRAVTARDATAMRRILEAVYVDRGSIDEILSRAEKRS